MNPSGLGNYTHNHRHSGAAPTTVTADTPEGAKAHHFAHRYKWALAQRRAASARVKDVRAEFQAAHAAQFAEIKEARAAARAMLAELMRESPEYSEAADDRKQASADMREILAEAAALGIDVDALKAAVALGELDPIERAERFDKIDVYAAAMSLWVE